jgi:predicted transcriptional regulator
MSWGQIAAKLKLKRSTAQTAYNRWDKHGVLERKKEEGRATNEG